MKSFKRLVFAGASLIALSTAAHAALSASEELQFQCGQTYDVVSDNYDQCIKAAMNGQKYTPKPKKGCPGDCAQPSNPQNTAISAGAQAAEQAANAKSRVCIDMSNGSQKCADVSANICSQPQGGYLALICSKFNTGF